MHKRRYEAVMLYINRDPEKLCTNRVPNKYQALTYESTRVKYTTFLCKCKEKERMNCLWQKRIYLRA